MNLIGDRRGMLAGDEMSGPGCYTMDLYCDQKPCKHPNQYTGFPYQYMGHTKAICKREARQNGWRFSRDRKHDSCPFCSGKRYK